MDSPKYWISVAEPWDFSGPDGRNRIDVKLLGSVNGPDLPNWAKQYALLQVSNPFCINSSQVFQLVVAPRYAGESLDSIIENGGTVGVSRVKPEIMLAPGARIQPEEVEYCIIGSLARKR